MDSNRQGQYIPPPASASQARNSGESGEPSVQNETPRRVLRRRRNHSAAVREQKNRYINAVRARGRARGQHLRGLQPRGSQPLGQLVNPSFLPGNASSLGMVPNPFLPPLQQQRQDQTINQSSFEEARARLRAYNSARRLVEPWLNQQGQRQQLPPPLSLPTIRPPGRVPNSFEEDMTIRHGMINEDQLASQPLQQTQDHQPPILASNALFPQQASIQQPQCHQPPVLASNAFFPQQASIQQPQGHQPPVLAPEVHFPQQASVQQPQGHQPSVLASNAFFPHQASVQQPQGHQPPVLAPEVHFPHQASVQQPQGHQPPVLAPEVHFPQQASVQQPQGHQPSVLASNAFFPQQASVQQPQQQMQNPFQQHEAHAGWQDTSHPFGDQYWQNVPQVAYYQCPHTGMISQIPMGPNYGAEPLDPRTFPYQTGATSNAPLMQPVSHFLGQPAATQFSQVDQPMPQPNNPLATTDIVLTNQSPVDSFYSFDPSPRLTPQDIAALDAHAAQLQRAPEPCPAEVQESTVTQAPAIVVTEPEEPQPPLSGLEQTVVSTFLSEAHARHVANAVDTQRSTNLRAGLAEPAGSSQPIQPPRNKTVTNQPAAATEESRASTTRGLLAPNGVNTLSAHANTQIAPALQIISLNQVTRHAAIRAERIKRPPGTWPWSISDPKLWAETIGLEEYSIPLGLLEDLARLVAKSPTEYEWYVRRRTELILENATIMAVGRATNWVKTQLGLEESLVPDVPHLMRGIISEQGHFTESEQTERKEATEEELRLGVEYTPDLSQMVLIRRDGSIHCVLTFSPGQEFDKALHRCILSVETVYRKQCRENMLIRVVYGVLTNGNQFWLVRKTPGFEILLTPNTYGPFDWESPEEQPLIYSSFCMMMRECLHLTRHENPTYLPVSHPAPLGLHKTAAAIKAQMGIVSAPASSPSSVPEVIVTNSHEPPAPVTVQGLIPPSGQLTWDSSIYTPADNVFTNRAPPLGVIRDDTPSVFALDPGKPQK